MKKLQIFISYSSHNEFEATLLQFAIEKLLEDKKVSVWTFQKDQKCSEKEVANSIKQKVKESIATVFLVSPYTLKSGATQWMELAYSHAFNVETYILLHNLSYKDLQTKGRSIPPLVTSSQCNLATKWELIINKMGTLCEKERKND